MNFRRFAGMSMLLAGQLLYAGLARADAWQDTLSTSISAEYETNPTMSSAQQEGVWRAMLDPRYTLVGRVGKSEITTGLALQIARSSNKTLVPDRDSPSVFFDWLRPSEAGEFGISARYAEVSTRDAGEAEATGRVPVDSTRISRSLSGNWNKELTERSLFTAAAAYERVKYKGGGSYTDYSTRSGSLNFTYIMTEQVTSFVRVSGNKYMPVSGGPSSSLVDATLGMNWNAEYMDWSMQVGKSRVVGGQSDTQGSVSAHYAGEQAQLTLIASRSISPSGLGGFVKSDLVRGSWNYAMSENSNAGLDLERRRNLSFAMNGVSTYSTTSGIRMDHDFSSFWSMRTSCQRRVVQEAGVRTSSNILGLFFIYSNADF